jgi:hypothetical protein
MKLELDEPDALNRYASDVHVLDSGNGEATAIRTETGPRNAKEAQPCPPRMIEAPV